MAREPPKVSLIPLTEDHIGHVMTWVNDPEVMGYFAGHQGRISFTEELMYIQKIVKSPTDLVFSVFSKETGDYIGQCSLNQIHWPSDNARIFLAVAREHHGKGYGEAILEALQDRAVKIGLHKLWLIVREDNHAAQAKYAKAGYHFEGVLRDEYRIGDQYLNMVRMGLILPQAK